MEFAIREDNFDLIKLLRKETKCLALLQAPKQNKEYCEKYFDEVRDVKIGKSVIKFAIESNNKQIIDKLRVYFEATRKKNH